ncbi:SEC14 cytosolic factor [Seminavis robusta]|uniref:SEC14 cytosolic factor n=1 Tax=Seminavis robusta TaxID=568900 RepID=A0A9N8DHB4_9STRA|nr:SEC14 cytosolic factor [Seminavis robusta]|eukprot:Sro143_g066490.1 SEC14 cytosolic factor (346) ;mRNA; f:22063-23180
MTLVNVRVVPIYSGSLAELADGRNNCKIVSKSKDPTDNGDFVSPDYGVPFESYLNLYHGMKVDPSKIIHYQQMNPEQQATYREFLKRVRKHDFEADGVDTSGTLQPFVQPDDMTCLRFLQADKYNADMALDRLVKSLKWSHEFQLARVISNPPPKLQTYRQIRVRGYMGRTRDGMPIFCERLGGMMNGIQSKEGRAFKEEDWLHCFIYDLGVIMKEFRQSYIENSGVYSPSKHPITWKAMWIIDAGGMNPFKAMKSTHTLKILDALTEPNFPEIAGPVVLINVHPIVMGVWRIVRSFLDPVTVEKITLDSGVPTEFLRKKIPEHVIFEEFGGTNKSKSFPQSIYV